MNVERIAVLHTAGGVLYQSIIEYGFDQYKQEESSALDARNGAGNWVVLPAADLPADFSIDTHTIIDGALVPASDEVIAARAAAKIAEQNAAIRETRRQLYDDPNGECAQLYWEWQETGKQEDYEAWMAAKNEIRKQNPYVDANN